MRFWRRSTVRARLTLLYAGAFVVAGALFISLMYFYLTQALADSLGSHLLPAAQSALGAHGLDKYPLLTSGLKALADEAEQQRQDTLHTMLVWSLASLGAVGLIAGALGWLLAGRLLEPLTNVTATARRIADRNLHERISLSGPDDEIKELADTFDAMLERLDRAFDVHQRFVSNASHELRTPLAINRTLIEVALGDPQVPESTRHLGETLLAVNARHERLIDGLLVLASSEQALTNVTQCDLAELASRALAAAQTAARRSQIRLSSDLIRTPVEGDPSLLERLVGNLVDNAVRYNIGGRGWVHAAVAPVDGRARLTVTNSGPRVPTDQVEGLFERFQRLAPAEQHGTASGAGLGLSIVRSVSTAHRGRVQALAHPRGGLTVEVLLPLDV